MSGMDEGRSGLAAESQIWYHGMRTSDATVQEHGRWEGAHPAQPGRHATDNRLGDQR